MDSIEYLPENLAIYLESLGMEFNKADQVLWQQGFRWFEEEHRMRPQFTNTIIRDSWYDKQIFYISQLIDRLEERSTESFTDLMSSDRAR
tara:strand:- start:9347 stop:9616 length:270 start_codon:yes stop_codon:yes gene_type:complete